MTDEGVTLTRFDDLLDESKGIAAVVLREWLLPAGGRDDVFFPPTYPKPQEGFSSDWLGYNIDVLPDGRKICLVDSVGSQANRLEALFKRSPYSSLVPQVHICINGTSVNLLDVGHRAADAIVRFSEGKEEFQRAFEAIRDKANYEPLAKIAPTSIVFGCWDSRGTQVKVQRIVGSVIRAFNVAPLHRSAQYRPPVRYIEAGLVDEPDAEQKEAYSEEGLLDIPSSWTHGGVILLDGGEIRRDAHLNLIAIRALSAGEDNATRKLQRYILGLALVVMTAPLEGNLREGCLLVRDEDRPPRMELVYVSGQRDSFELSHEEAKKFADLAAKEFGVGESKTFKFQSDLAKKHLAKSKDERKKARRGKA